MPHLGPTTEGKNELFQHLKPPCVALGQAAVALNGTRGGVQTASEHLQTIKYILSSASSKRPGVLDAKLADYVFFPIAQLLKASQRLSIRCLELSLNCIAILIDQGWRESLPPKLAAQIVILCSLMGEKKPSGLSFSETTDELQAMSFWCLYHLFSSAGENAETKSLLTNDSNFPQLGQTISVVLEGVHDTTSAETQIAATSALEALVKHVVDREIQASFFPGIVSKLTRVLTPQTKLRRNPRVLVGCLDILDHLLKSTMNDAGFQKSSSRKDAQTRTIIDQEWQEMAASQLRPAISNILRLKSHGRDDVRASIARLCLTLLLNCRRTLSNCSRLALETLIALSAGQREKPASSEIEYLVQTDSSITALLQDMLYDWLQSLTTVMQGSDEQAKATKLDQIRVVYGLLSEAGADMSALHRMLAASIRDSIVVTLTVPGNNQEPHSSASPIQSLELSILNENKSNTEYESPLVKYRGQEESLSSLESFAKLISTSTYSATFASDLARSLSHSQGDPQIASFWLLLTVTETALQRKHHIDDLLNLEEEPRSLYNEYLEEIFSFSLATLTSSSDVQTDPRLQALALRGLALRAKVVGEEFRYELVDALYPVLHTLATSDEQLQRDSITTLNIIASACNYVSVKDLVVDNVDYLTNAVALKLNAFDVSPQAPQVLLMMVRLAGPSLLPYLEDTVESIFAALADYHGYPLLVELLFKVLGVVAEEGVRAPQLAITAETSKMLGNVRRETWQPTSTESLVALLRERAEEEVNSRNLETEPRESHPQRPWKDDEKESKSDEDDEELMASHDEQIDDAEPPPPAPKTYGLLLKITELTQHFLPSASPSLRTSLLVLIRTTIPAIALHENSFLPLVNTLWPEVTSRLYDDEPHIVANALEIVGELCQYAGDFMRSRMIQLWPALLDIYKSTTRDIMHANLRQGETAKNSLQESAALVPKGSRLTVAISRMDASSSSYGDTSSRLLWNAILFTLTSLLENVEVSPEVFDEALQMLHPVLSQPAIRSALEKVNADAVWLARMRSGGVAKPNLPCLPENSTWQFAEVPG